MNELKNRHRFEPELFKWYKAQAGMDQLYRVFYKIESGKIYYINVRMHYRMIEKDVEFTRYMKNRESDHTPVKTLPKKYRKELVKYIFEAFFNE